MIGHLLCELKLHDWSRWSVESVTKWEGMKPKEVSAQSRECIRCGYRNFKLIEVLK